MQRASAGSARRGLRSIRPLLACATAALILAAPAGAQTFPGVPDPGGDQDRAVSVPPPPGKFFGYHEDTAEGDTHSWNASELAGVAKGGGANVHRFAVGWWNVEPKPDRWNENWWARYRRMYDAALAKGMRPIITLGSTPEWARDYIGRNCGLRRGCEYPPAAWALDEWAEYAAEVARRFPKTAAIEIWNEANIVNFWKPLPNPSRFAQLVDAAYPAIKAANPDMTVLAGSFAPAFKSAYNLAGQRTVIPMREFLDNAYKATPSINGKLNGISFHTTINQLNYGAESLFAKSFYDVRNTAAAHGDAGTRLWITETGITTTGAAAHTELEQAVGLTWQYRKMMQMPDVRAMVVHTLADQLMFSPSDKAFGYGVIQRWSPFDPKLAYCAFAGRVNTPTPYGGCPRVYE